MSSYRAIALGQFTLPLSAVLTPSEKSIAPSVLFTFRIILKLEKSSTFTRKKSLEGLRRLNPTNSGGQELDGLALGEVDGLGVGPPVGGLDGDSDGLALGEADGLGVGPPVGGLDGEADGPAEGDSDGLGVGPPVGGLDGDSDGLGVGPPVGWLDGDGGRLIVDIHL